MLVYSNPEKAGLDTSNKGVDGTVSQKMLKKRNLAACLAM